MFIVNQTINLTHNIIVFNISLDSPLMSAFVLTQKEEISQNKSKRN